MTRKMVYYALEKLERGEIMKPDVMNVIDAWMDNEISELSKHNRLIIEDLKLTRETLKICYQDNKRDPWDDLGRNLSETTK